MGGRGPRPQTSQTRRLARAGSTDAPGRLAVGWAYRLRAVSCRPARPQAVGKEISMMRLSRLCLSILLLGLVLGSVTAATAKAPPPSGTLTISTTSIAVGIGVNWGTGFLTTRGNRYPFTL